MELQRRSSGVAKAGLTTGIIGTAVGALNSLALLGQGAAGIARMGVSENAGVCTEDHMVNRYELSLLQKIAEKDSQLMLKDAVTDQDKKMLEVYRYIDGQLKDVRSELSRQAVINQQVVDSFEMADKNLQCCCDRLQVQIEREADRRKCDDDIIVAYANGTFYPKSVADVTVGTTSTQQRVYNPLPRRAECNMG